MGVTIAVTTRPYGTARSPLTSTTRCGARRKAAVARGASIVRVHDVLANVRAAQMTDAVVRGTAAARGSYALLMFGLACSIPLIMAGAAAVIALLERFPVIVWAGAALLGWIVNGTA